MSIERRLQESMERHAEDIEPGPDPLGRATRRLRRSQRQRGVGLVAALVLVSAGCVYALTQWKGSASREPVVPAPSATGSAQPVGHAVPFTMFASKRVGVAVTDTGLALTRDAGGSWTEIERTGPWSGDVAFSGGMLFAAFERDGRISIQRYPIEEPPTTTCHQPCSIGFDLTTGRPGPNGYQGLWLSFATPTHGWLNVGLSQTEIDSVAELYETTDGGTTWKLVSRPSVGPIVFIDDRTGYLKGSLAGSSEGDRLFRTADGGRTWRDVTPPTPAGCNRNEAGIPLPHFFDAQNGVFLSTLACGSFDYTAGEIIVTTDGGTTWARRGTLKLADPTRTAILSVADADTFVVTSGRSILESTDGGRSFKTVATHRDVIVTGFTFLDPGFGWTTVVRGDCTSKTCSDPPRLYVTFDRGRSLRAIDVFY